MKVFTFQSSGPAVIEDGAPQANPANGPRLAWNATIPATGYWRRGDMVKGLGANAALMWVCTTEGVAGSGAAWSVITAGP